MRNSKSKKAAPGAAASGSTRQGILPFAYEAAPAVPEEPPDDPRIRCADALFQKYLDQESFGPARRHDRVTCAKLATDLDRFTQWLAEHPGRSLYEAQFWLDGEAVVREDLRPKAEALFFAVLNHGGTGTWNKQQSLLDVLAQSALPESVPFWKDVATLVRPRDPNSKLRRRMALAALAFLQTRRPGSQAGAALEGLMAADDPALRAEAAYYSVLPYAIHHRKLPEALKASLQAMAREESTFWPRFLADLALFSVGEDVPVNPLAGVVRFAVSHRSASFRCEIDVAGSATLDDLYGGILDALEWDCDHLACFWFEAWAEDRTCFYSSEADDHALYMTALPLRALGLGKGVRFTFLFDFGDRHTFDVRVVHLGPAETRMQRYHVHSRSTPPEQYQRD